MRRLAAIGFLVLLWLVASWGVAYRLTRRPRSVFAETAPVVSWGTLESHRLCTRDGERLGAWFLPGGRDSPAVLLLHGNGGSRRNCLDRAEMLAARACPVLMISLRAHGDSTGEYNDIGYGARLDVVAAVDFLERRCPGQPIVVHAESMGSAAAIFAARELAHRVRGYVLESPYRDLRTAVWNRTENALSPALGWIAYRGLVVASPLVLPHLDRISPLDAIGGVPADVPVLILAGELDRRARPDEARALFDRVRDHGSLHLFPGSDHLEMRRRDPARFREAVFGMLDRVGRSRRDPSHTGNRS